MLIRVVVLSIIRARHEGYSNRHAPTTRRTAWSRHLHGAVRIPHTPGNRPGHLDPCSRAVVPETGAQFRAAVPVRCGQRQATAAGPGQHLAGRCRVPAPAASHGPRKLGRGHRNAHETSTRAALTPGAAAVVLPGFAKALREHVAAAPVGELATQAAAPKPAPTQGGTKLDARRRAQVSRRTRPGVDCFGTSRRDCYGGAAARRPRRNPPRPCPVSRH